MLSIYQQVSIRGGLGGIEGVLGLVRCTLAEWRSASAVSFVLSCLMGWLSLFSGIATADDTAPEASTEEDSTLNEREESEAVVGQWWLETRQALFVGVDLSSEQEAELDAIVARGVGERDRFQDLREQMLAAQVNRDQASLERISVELQAIREVLKPRGRLDQMREVLNAEQQATFDRARRLWRDQRLAEEQKRQRGTLRAAGAQEEKGKQGN